MTRTDSDLTGMAKGLPAARSPVMALPISTMVLLLIAMLCPTTGCSVLHDVKKSTKHEWGFRISNRKIKKQVEILAEESFYRLVQSDPRCAARRHFRVGFIDGFSRYALSGNSVPPKLPPPKYRKAKYVSAEGHGAIEEWFRGHEMGMIAAEQSGYRHYVTLPHRFAPAMPVEVTRPPAGAWPRPAGALPREELIEPPQPMPFSELHGDVNVSRDDSVSWVNAIAEPQQEAAVAKAAWLDAEDTASPMSRNRSYRVIPLPPIESTD